MTAGIERFERLGKHVGRHAGGGLLTAAARGRCHHDGDRSISGRLADGGILAADGRQCREQDGEGRDEEPWM
jgi:hypothetical protein